MLIYFEFDKDFNMKNVNPVNFSLDIDIRSDNDVDNIKTHITLQFSEMDIDSFELYLD